MEKPYSSFDDDDTFYRIKDTLVNQILHDFNSNLVAPDERNQAMVDLIIQKFREQEIPINDDKRDPLFRQVINEVLGFGILQPFLDDPDVSEILVNGKDSEPKLNFIPYSTFGNYEDVMRRVPDITKICSKLGFKPKWDLEQGLIETINWQKQFI